MGVCFSDQCCLDCFGRDIYGCCCLGDPYYRNRAVGLHPGYQFGHHQHPSGGYPAFGSWGRGLGWINRGDRLAALDNQIVITPPGSVPGTLYRSQPYPSPYGLGGLAPTNYGYSAPLPIGAPALASSDYSQRPLPPAPQNPYFPTVPEPAAHHYPPAIIGGYREPLIRPSSGVSLATFAQPQSRHHRGDRHHSKRGDSYQDQYQDGNGYDTPDPHRHRRHEKRDRRHSRRKERYDTEAYHGGYYAPEAGYENHQ
ncbi:hypothetical protein NliqN6_1085 [Naganishia liquefaciens]|uniref:Uncharacterized protein n=1 Tax=Naganishia liquefaciens TaxID=104408 RepID=A0A8H3YCZ3_9TREE|nr:hypothetical protein NliqN6_1085 [Naganishia liquefaciens]